MSAIVPVTLNPLGSVPGSTDVGLTPKLDIAKPPSQGNLFAKILDEVTDLDAQADDLQKRMYAGDGVEVHQVMIANEEAGTAFELLVETRNRLVDAYQELMRMPV